MGRERELPVLPQEGPLSGAVETSYFEAPLPDSGGAEGKEEGLAVRSSLEAAPQLSLFPSQEAVHALDPVEWASLPSLCH